MQETLDADKTFGLYMTAGELAYAVASWKKKEPALELVDRLIFSEDVKPLDMEAKEILKKAASSRLSVSALNASSCLVRSIFIPLKKAKDIEEALSFQIEPLLPFPIEQALLEWQLISQDDKGSQVTVFAIKKEFLEEHLNACNELGIDPEIATSMANALAEFSSRILVKEEAFFILYVDHEESLITLVKEGKVIASQPLDFSLKILLETYHEDCLSNDADGFPRPSFSELDFIQGISFYPNLEKQLLEVKLNLARAHSLLSKQLKTEEANELLITGDLVNYPYLKILFKNELRAEELELNPLLFDAAKEKVLKEALPIGLSFMGLPKAKSYINFRKQEFAYAKPWKRLALPALTFLTASFLIAASLYFAGVTYIDYKENELSQEFSNVKLEFNHSLAFAIKANEKKHPQKEMESISHSFKDMSKEEIAYELERMERQIKDAPDTIALLPNTARVCDVLAWLSNHPKIKLEGVNEKGLVLESFSYTLLKRPEEKKKQNRYQVKVELEFTSDTPKQAREFHDALIAQNEFVDAKSEIKWSSSRGRYRTSFFLKDKTIYPTPRSF